jgi:hypothetical protein
LTVTAAKGHLTPDDGRAWLREIAAVVEAWAHTVVGCYAVEAYNFDPGADPAGRS